MKKNIIVVLLIISLLINGVLSIEVNAAEVPSLMQIAYDEIASQRALWGAVPVTGYDVDVWNEYNVLVVDIPGTFPSNLTTLKEPDGSANDYNSGAGEYRYIGYNPDGYLVNNPKYPDDHSGSAVINTYDWQENTDGKTDINQYISSAEDQAFYENEIFYFLEKEYGLRFDETEDPSRWIDNAIVIVPVSSTGNGVIKYMHKWDSNHDGVKENWYITVNLRSKNSAGDIFIEEEPKEEITKHPVENMDGHGEGIIQADLRGNEAFEASIAVPSSEPLYIQVRAKEYVYELEYENVKGIKSYPVTVTRSYKLIKGVKDEITGEIKAVSKTVPVSKTYQIAREYDFHLIQKLGVFSLDQAIVKNNALPNGIQTLLSSVEQPEVAMDRNSDISAHMTEPVSGPLMLSLPTKTIGSTANRSFPSVPSENFRPTAEQAVGPIQVKNDELMFNGETLMDSGVYNTTAPTPKIIPDASLNSINDLYRPNLIIPPTMPNGLKNSQGELVYKTVIDTEGRIEHRDPISTINTVTVHTPVVAYPNINEDPTYIQVMDKNTSVENLVLDRSFIVEYPNSGQHISSKGYGNNDYEKYISQKQIKFNFDTYYGSSRNGTFVQANTWFTLDKTLEQYTFFIPHWVKEGSGEILYRVIPINDVGDSNAHEYNANLDLVNYRAVDRVNVELIGQIYDFQILATTDPMFKEFFFTENNRDNSLYVGPKDKFKNVLSYRDDILPLMPGTNTVAGYQNKTIKKGHAVFFSIKSVGNMSDNNDFLTLSPKFYYVDLSGNGRRDVDIWYKVNGSYVKMDTQVKEIKMSLNNMYTNVENMELNDTAIGMHTLFGSALSLSEYKEHYFWQESRTAAKVGDTSLIALDWQQRTFIGETNLLPSSVPYVNALTGRQQFYGMYMIPASAIAVPKGTTTQNVMSSVLKNGYIVVNFDVSSIDGFNGDATDIRLSYDKAEGNMYTVEDYKTSQNGFNLIQGDAVFYSTDQSADSDYSSITTH